LLGLQEFDLKPQPKNANKTQRVLPPKTQFNLSSKH